MKQGKDRPEPDRRSFLKLAGVGIATGGVAMAMGKDPAQSREEEPSESGGYRETEHVRTYYDLAKF